MIGMAQTQGSFHGCESYMLLICYFAVLSVTDILRPVAVELSWDFLDFGVSYMVTFKE